MGHPRGTPPGEKSALDPITWGPAGKYPWARKIRGPRNRRPPRECVEPPRGEVPRGPRENPWAPRRKLWGPPPEIPWAPPRKIPGSVGPRRAWGPPPGGRPRRENGPPPGKCGGPREGNPGPPPENMGPHRGVRGPPTSEFTRKRRNHVGPHPSRGPHREIRVKILRGNPWAPTRKSH